MKYLALALLFLSGCVTPPEVMTRQYEPVKGIIIRYPIAVMYESINKSSRERTIKEAAEFCGKDAKILSESNQAQTDGLIGMPMGNGGSTMMASATHYMYMSFRCD